MGTITSALGLEGGVSGTGVEGPKAANIVAGPAVQHGTTAEQIAASQAGTQGGLGNQQALLQALQAQQGLGNQSQVYGQLQNVAAGQGPNPAQAMLANATGTNVANQAALMAGQRGAGANPALIARQAAMQGGNLQQQALGQAAAMQAQQSLGALGAAGQMATQQAGQQIGQTNANLAGQLSNQQLQQQALATQGGLEQQQAAALNQANVASQGNVNQANASMFGAQKGVQTQGFKSIGEGVAGGAKALGMMGAEGGVIPGGSRMSLGKFLNHPTPMTWGGNVGSALKGGGGVPGDAKYSGNNYGNDTVNALLSPGELVVDRETMNDQGPAGDAARFLAAVISAKKKGKK